MLIADSHQFEATNLVKVAQIISLPKGFTYTYATPAGDVIKEPLMMAHEFELSKDDLVFYEAQR
ncbi:MAG TPA: hypothetical protein VJ464_15950 [Blastocatellia bacterium]|nr:hypothetical protein [Blastocatellia bacterium]